MTELFCIIRLPSDIQLFRERVVSGFEKTDGDGAVPLVTPVRGVAPFFDTANPLIRGNAKVLLANTSGHEVHLYDIPSDSIFAPAPRPGVIRTVIRDDTGTVVHFYDPLTRSLKDDDVRTYSSQTGGLSSRTLSPEQSVEMPFELLGPITVGGVKPGVYTIRAVFEYLSAPDGEVKSVTSEPVTVEITADHIARWQRWLAAGG